MWPRQGWERRAPCKPASRRCCRPHLCLSPWSKFTQELFISNTKSLCTVSHHQSANTHVCTHTLCEIPMATLTCWLAMKRCPKVSRKFPVLKDGFLSDCTFPFKWHYFLVVYELSCLASLFCFEKCQEMAKAVKEFWMPLSALPLPHASAGWSCSLSRHQRPPLYLFSGFWFATWQVLCIWLTALETEC